MLKDTLTVWVKLMEIMEKQCKDHKIQQLKNHSNPLQLINSFH